MNDMSTPDAAGSAPAGGLDATRACLGAGRVAGKVAVVTGSTRGFGLAVARALAREGAAVVVSSRSPEATQRAAAQLVAEGYRALGAPCDVGDLGQVEALAQRAIDAFGRIDVWVNNAGATSTYGPVTAIQPEAFTRVVQTNVLGTYHGSLVALRHMLPVRRGKLINVLGRGDRQHTPFLVAYGASKTWVRSFTLALAQEHKDRGTGIYAINPGLMRTDLMTHIEAVQGYERRVQPLATVLRLLGQPPEVPAERVVWLASAATDNRTGLEVRAQGRFQTLCHAAREGIRWLRGRSAPVTLDVTTVPPAPPAV